MSNVRSLNLGDAMLQRGKSPAQAADNNTPTVTQPVNEMAMVLTLDQLRPNPDNPRKGRNPRFEEIKASVRARGLDSIPKVTRDPDGDDVYIFSDGEIPGIRYSAISGKRLVMNVFIAFTRSSNPGLDV
jgi:glucose/arabinose dehydrogenase